MLAYLKLSMDSAAQNPVQHAPHVPRMFIQEVL